MSAHAVIELPGPYLYGVADGGNLYQVDMTTKASTVLYSESSPSSFAQPNALALDTISKILYYRSATNGDLYSYNINTGVRSASSLITAAAIGNSASDAAFWGGSYWFVKDSSSTLVRISNLSGTPTVATFDLGAGSNLSFGDIAINASGTLYGQTSDSRFFSADISTLRTATSGTAANTSFSVRTGTNVASLQIAFSPDESVLYGHNRAGTTADDRWYTINFFGNATTNTNFGTATPITGWNDTLVYRDIAGGIAVVPEPSTLVPFGIVGLLGIVGTGTARLRRRAKK